MKEDLKVVRIAILCVLALFALLIFTLLTGDFSNPSKKITHIQSSLGVLQDSLQSKFAQLTIKNPTLLVDSSKQHILFIGDSMAEGLAIPLKKYAQYNGHQLTTIAKTSASIAGWLGRDSTGKLRKAIEEHKPTYLIISLGSNELFTTYLENYEENLQNILAQAGKIKLLWICPPNWKQDNGLTDLMEKVIGKDRFFPSKVLKIPRAGDKIHPTFQGYTFWTDAIADWVMQEARHKIVLQKPVEE